MADFFGGNKSLRGKFDYAKQRVKENVGDWVREAKQTQGPTKLTPEEVSKIYEWANKKSASSFGEMLAIKLAREKLAEIEGNKPVNQMDKGQTASTGGDVVATNMPRKRGREYSISFEDFANALGEHNSTPDDER